MAAKSLPTVRIQNIGGAQTNVPLTFGHVFAPGDLAPTDGLMGGKLPLQVDVKATHADGSVRHAILSGVLPKLAAGETLDLPLSKAAPTNKYPDVDVAAVLQNLDARVVLNLAGQEYTASLKDADPRSAIVWLVGPTVVEGSVTVPLKGAAGPHRLLEARFRVRYYLATKQTRVEFKVENTKTFTSAEKLKYDVQLFLNGKVTFSQTGMDHYHHSLWHECAWTGQEPNINVQFDTAYLLLTGALPNLNMANSPTESLIVGMAKSINADNTGPMKVGPVTWNMGTTGARNDIGIIPTWTAMWLLSMDKRLYDVMIAAADGSGSWTIHYRDENTGYPVRTDNDKNKDITLHWNLRNRGPLPVPRFFNDNPDAPGGSYRPYDDDTSHQPSLAYVPYLVTGEYRYLEELQFWASSNPLNTDPAGSGHGQGLVRWQQLRGQAWSMRTLGQAAYITPDDHPLKDYFIKQLQNNLAFYTQTYVEKNPNNLGAYDGSGEGSFNDPEYFAPWQDDFFTGVLGQIVQMGFKEAAPLLAWKAKYPVGRMTAPGFCWIGAASYILNMRPGKGKPAYGSFAEVWQATFGGDQMYNDKIIWCPSTSKDGKRFADMLCASQEQADFLGSINGFTWSVRRMIGYADSAMGYPAWMQPALAAAVDAGIPNAQEALDLFGTRSAKPDYRIAPQWDILPANVKQTGKVAMAPIPPLPALEIGKAPEQDIAGTWAKAGNEGDKLKFPVGTWLRYGVPGGPYRYAKTVLEQVTIDNPTFGGDPVPNVVKVLEAFTPAPPAKPGTLKTSGNSLLKKLKDLVVKVVDPKTLQIVSKFSGVKPASTGSITVSGTDIVRKSVYAVVIEDAAGNVIDIMFPVTAT